MLKTLGEFPLTVNCSHYKTIFLFHKFNYDLLNKSGLLSSLFLDFCFAGGIICIKSLSLLTLRLSTEIFTLRKLKHFTFFKATQLSSCIYSSKRTKRYNWNLTEALLIVLFMLLPTVFICRKLQCNNFLSVHLFLKN